MSVESGAQSCLSEVTVYVVRPDSDKLKPSEADENLSEEEINLQKVAFEELKRLEIYPEWTTRECCLNVKRRTKDFYVLPAFRGQVFEHLENLNMKVYGPPVVLSCLREGISLPKFTHPIYSRHFENFHISFTGLTINEKARLTSLILYLGGLSYKQLTENATHLIAKTCSTDSEKYRAAIGRKLPVVLPDWVESIWQMAVKEDAHSLRENNNVRDRVGAEQVKLLTPIFAGLVISLSGYSSTDRRDLSKLIERNGGRFSGEMRDGVCTHLIVETETGDKYRKAVTWNTIQIVTAGWLLQCDAMGYRLEEAAFALNSTTGLKRPAPVMVRASTPMSSTNRPASSLLDPNFSAITCTESQKEMAENRREIQKIMEDETVDDRQTVCDSVLPGPVTTGDSGGAEIGRKRNGLPATSSSVSAKKKKMTDLNDEKSVDRVPMDMELTGVTMNQPMDNNNGKSVEAANENDNCALEKKIFYEKTFRLIGLSDEVAPNICELIIQNGGTLEKTADKIADFAVCPLFDYENCPLDARQFKCQNVVTIIWLRKCIEKRECLETDGDALFRPFGSLSGTGILKGCILCLDTIAIGCWNRDVLLEIAQHLGARVEEDLRRVSDVKAGTEHFLIATSNRSSKSDRMQTARALNIQMVHPNWLLKCIIKNYKVPVQEFTLSLENRWQSAGIFQNNNNININYYNNNVPVVFERTDQHWVLARNRDREEDQWKTRKSSNLTETSMPANEFRPKYRNLDQLKQAIDQMPSPEPSPPIFSAKFIKEMLNRAVENTARGLPKHCRTYTTESQKDHIEAKDNLAEEDVVIVKDNFAADPDDDVVIVESVVADKMTAPVVKSPVVVVHAEPTAQMQVQTVSSHKKTGNDGQLALITSQLEAVIQTPVLPKEAVNGCLLPINHNVDTPRLQQQQGNVSKRKSAMVEWCDNLDSLDRIEAETSQEQREDEEYGVGQKEKPKMTPNSQNRFVTRRPPLAPKSSAEAHQNDKMPTVERAKNHKSSPSANDKPAAAVIERSTKSTSDDQQMINSKSTNHKKLQVAKLSRVQKHSNEIERPDEELAIIASAGDITGSDMNKRAVTNTDQSDLNSDDIFVGSEVGREKGEKRPKRFLFTAVADDIKSELREIVLKLGGECYDGKEFDADCSHLISAAMIRNEKLLSCMASGKFVLHPEYLIKSERSNRFLDEKAFEWGNENSKLNTEALSKDERTKKLALACKRWRVQLADTGAGAFNGWNCVLYVSGKKAQGIKSLLTSGGAVVFDRSDNALLTNVNRAFIESYKDFDRKDLTKLISLNIKCFRAEYIANYLMDDPPDEVAGFWPDYRAAIQK